MTLTMTIGQLGSVFMLRLGWCPFWFAQKALCYCKIFGVICGFYGSSMSTDNYGVLVAENNWNYGYGRHFYTKKATKKVIIQKV